MCAREKCLLQLLNTISYSCKPLFYHDIFYYLYTDIFTLRVHNTSYIYNTQCEIHCSKDTLSEACKGLLFFLFFSPFYIYSQSFFLLKY